MELMTNLRILDEAEAHRLVSNFFKDAKFESRICFIKGKHGEDDVVYISVSEPNQGEKRTDAKAERLESEKELTKKTKVKNKPFLKKIEAIEKIAKDSSTYTEFVNSVAIWLELGKSSKFFIDSINAATQIDNISWENIQKRLKGNYKNHDKQQCTSKVTKKFYQIGYTMRFMNLVKIIVSYKNFEFNASQII